MNYTFFSPKSRARIVPVQFDPRRKATTLVRAYGQGEAFKVAAARKAEAFAGVLYGAPVSYPGTMADYWADVELCILGETPDNLEADERVGE